MRNNLFYFTNISPRPLKVATTKAVSIIKSTAKRLFTKYYSIVLLFKKNSHLLLGGQCYTFVLLFESKDNDTMKTTISVQIQFAER